MSVWEIVVVEDNPADVVLLKEALKHYGLACRLKHYSNGEDAATAIRAMVTAPALLLVDLNMPRVPGLELLHVIRASPVLDEVPVAILTSSRDPDDRVESERLGADAYIVKPPGYYDFVATVGEAIAQLLQHKAPGACGRYVHRYKSARLQKPRHERGTNRTPRRCGCIGRRLLF